LQSASLSCFLNAYFENYNIEGSTYIFFSILAAQGSIQRVGNYFGRQRKRTVRLRTWALFRRKIQAMSIFSITDVT
jgi:hypothetical protein